MMKFFSCLTFIACFAAIIEACNCPSRSPRELFCRPNTEAVTNFAAVATVTKILRATDEFVCSIVVGFSGPMSTGEPITINMRRPLLDLTSCSAGVPALSAVVLGGTYLVAGTTDPNTGINHIGVCDLLRPWELLDISEREMWTDFASNPDVSCGRSCSSGCLVYADACKQCKCALDGSFLECRKLCDPDDHPEPQCVCHANKPQEGCPLICSKYKMNSDGCASCECEEDLEISACALLKCALGSECQNGKCVCLLQAPQEECPLLCATYKTNADGCHTCECEEELEISACALLKCAAGTECHNGECITVEGTVRNILNGGLLGGVTGTVAGVVGGTLGSVVGTVNSVTGAVLHGIADIDLCLGDNACGDGLACNILDGPSRQCLDVDLVLNGLRDPCTLPSACAPTQGCRLVNNLAVCVELAAEVDLCAAAGCSNSPCRVINNVGVCLDVEVEIAEIPIVLDVDVDTGAILGACAEVAADVQTNLIGGVVGGVVGTLGGVVGTVDGVLNHVINGAITVDIDHDACQPGESCRIGQDGLLSCLRVDVDLDGKPNPCLLANVCNQPNTGCNLVNQLVHCVALTAEELLLCPLLGCANGCRVTNGEAVCLDVEVDVNVAGCPVSLDVDLSTSEVVACVGVVGDAAGGLLG